MAVIKKNITVTEQQEAWIQSQLAMGHYASDSELLRDLIKKEQVRIKEEAIRRELIKGEQSGLSARSPEEIVNAVLKRREANGLQIK